MIIIESVHKMKEILSASQMQACDNHTIELHGIPSLVLMERAALAVVETLDKYYPQANSFAVVCGPGNNGGDGVAIARLLSLKGKKVNCVVLGDSDKFSTQLRQEISIAKSYDLSIEKELNKNAINQADLTIDAMFGIGLTRGLSGDFEDAAVYINQSAKKVLAVDIPSGYDADCGKLLGTTGVLADLTVTFAYMKKGLILGDCKVAAGKVEVADVGIYLDKSDDKYDTIIEADILKQVNPRPVNANKGSCGKLLIIAGSESIYGACFLAAKAALQTGAGLVKIYTHKNNILSIQQNLPEAMYLGYDSFNASELSKEMNWADAVLIGPGLGTEELSSMLLSQVLKEINVPLVIDADGLNLISRNDLKADFKAAAERIPVIITPHLKEMERLCGTSTKEINYNMEQVAKSYALENGCIVVLKNFTTVVASKGQTYFVTSGNEALATPGSGDVLAGIIASFVLQKVCDDCEMSVCAAVFLHGFAGVKASEKYGTRGVLASHIIDYIPKL